MPRYDAEDEYQETRGVHRRRLQRTTSTTPIIIGGVLVLGVIIVVAILALGHKKDPAAEKAAIRAAAQKFLMAALSGDRKAIFGQIDVTGSHGWMTVHHPRENVNKYRFAGELKGAEGEAAKSFRFEQNSRIFKEIKSFPERLALTAENVQEAIKNSGLKRDYSKAEVEIVNQGGRGKIVLLGEDEDWVVQNWEVEFSARGR